MEKAREPRSCAPHPDKGRQGRPDRVWKALFIKTKNKKIINSTKNLVVSKKNFELSS